MAPRNRRVIDLSALENNMRLIRGSVPRESRIMAVVKADGYGHGVENRGDEPLDIIALIIYG